MPHHKRTSTPTFSAIRRRQARTKLTMSYKRVRRPTNFRKFVVRHRLAHEDGQDHDRTVKPDSRRHEDLRAGRSGREGKRVREERPRSPCRSERPRSNCAADVGSLAQPAHPRRRARTPTHWGRSAKPGLPHSHVDPWRRSDHCDVLRHCGRGTSQLQEVSVRRRLARPDDQALSIGTSRL